jgi:D-alanine-D-alanine ligase
MIIVDPDWWKTLFDDVYLMTDARIVCNPALTKREVDVAEKALELRSSDRILDLCGGQGRHSLELARRGYRHLTVVDYAMFLMQRGQHVAMRDDLGVGFCRGDARAIPMRSASVDVVLLMANSFGYFVDAADDRRVLDEVSRVLTPTGRFLLDLMDFDYVRRHLVRESWHEETKELVVCWKRELVNDVIRVREIVLSKTQGLLRDRTYAERLYHPDYLCELLHDTGFVRSKVHPDAFVFSPKADTDYGIATHRMLITARKG